MKETVLIPCLATCCENELTTSQPPTPKLRPKHAPNTLTISVDLTRPLHEPFKIEDLGLLTHIFKESVTWQFLWCNSQHPYGSIEHDKISILTTSQPPTPKLRPPKYPKHSFDFNRPQPTPS